MSPPDSPTLGNDRVYRFISDPGHKENLSGRVRAACLTCRRKKIKCSGELNCRTCREKGLVCEGLPERKRPRRDGPGLSIEEPAFTGIERNRKPSLSKSKAGSKRPTAHLQSTDRSISNDSGYTSMIPNVLDTPISPTTSQPHSIASSQNLKLAPTTFADIEPSPNPSPITLASETLSLGGEQIPSAQYDASVAAPADISHGNSIPFTTTPSSQAEWPDMLPSHQWWAETAGEIGSTDDPFLLGKTPEEQVPIPRSASSKSNGDLADMFNRRQTIAFPLPTPSSFEGRLDYLANHPGAFDDMALLSFDRTPGRTPGTGMTPGVTEFHSWWDVNGQMSLLGMGSTGHSILSDQSLNAMLPSHEQQQQTTTNGISLRKASNFSQVQEAAESYFVSVHNWAG